MVKKLVALRKVRLTNTFKSQSRKPLCDSLVRSNEYEYTYVCTYIAQNNKMLQSSSEPHGRDVSRIFIHL